MPMTMPTFTASTRPSDGVRDALMWAVAEVEGTLHPGSIDESRYLRSRREFSVRRGSTTLTWYFSSSKWNLTGHGIWLHRGMALRDDRLGGWRSNHVDRATETGDFVDHVRLDPGGDTVVWQPEGAARHPFADHDLAALPDTLISDAARAFDAYAEPLTAVNAVPVTHLTAANVAAFGELALALDRPSEAEEVLRRALERRPILEEYVRPIAERLGLASALPHAGRLEQRST
ncbi:hypothetical protein [Amnibacterium kyonggiense]